MSSVARSKVFPEPTRASDCLVLRTWPTGETSIIASLLSEQNGYVRVIAKGARKLKSRLRGLIQPCNLVNLEYSWREDRELQYLRGGQLRVSPLLESASLERSACLLALVELVDRCRLDPGPAVDLFGFCRDYLSVLSSTGEAAEVIRFYRFELALLDFHGVAPHFQDCAGCGRSGFAEQCMAVAFDIAQGGIICETCRDSTGSTAIRRLDLETCDYLRKLQSGALNILSQVAAPRPGVQRAAGIILHHFLTYHLEGYRLPAGLDMLRAQKAHARDPDTLAAMEDEIS